MWCPLKIIKTMHVLLHVHVNTYLHNSRINWKLRINLLHVDVCILLRNARMHIRTYFPTCRKLFNSCCNMNSFLYVWIYVCTYMCIYVHVHFYINTNIKICHIVHKDMCSAYVLMYMNTFAIVYIHTSAWKYIHT